MTKTQIHTELKALVTKQCHCFPPCTMLTVARENLVAELSALIENSTKFPHAECPRCGYPNRAKTLTIARTRSRAFKHKITGIENSVPIGDRDYEEEEYGV